MTPPLKVYHTPSSHDRGLPTEVTKKGHWSYEEEQVLLNLFVSDPDPTSIARNLGRSPNAVIAKLVQLRLIRWSISYKAYFKVPQPG